MDEDREQLSELLKSLDSSSHIVEGAYLIRGIIITEWLNPETGSKFLVEHEIGDMNAWDTQGFLFNVLHGAPAVYVGEDGEDEDPDD